MAPGDPELPCLAQARATAERLVCPRASPGSAPPAAPAGPSTAEQEGSGGSLRTDPRPHLGPNPTGRQALSSPTPSCPASRACLAMSPQRTPREDCLRGGLGPALPQPALCSLPCAAPRAAPPQGHPGLAGSLWAPHTGQPPQHHHRPVLQGQPTALAQAGGHWPGSQQEPEHRADDRVVVQCDMVVQGEFQVILQPAVEHDLQGRAG